MIFDLPVPSNLTVTVRPEKLGFDKSNTRARMRLAPAFGLDSDELSEAMSQIENISKSHIKEALTSLELSIVRHLAFGNAIDLGGIGTMRLSVQTNAQENLEELKRNPKRYVKRIRPIFTASKLAKQRIVQAKLNVRNYIPADYVDESLLTPQNLAYKVKSITVGTAKRVDGVFTELDWLHTHGEDCIVPTIDSIDIKEFAEWEQTEGDYVDMHAFAIRFNDFLSSDIIEALWKKHHPTDVRFKVSFGVPNTVEGTWSVITKYASAPSISSLEDFKSWLSNDAVFYTNAYDTCVEGTFTRGTFVHEIQMVMSSDEDTYTNTVYKYAPISNYYPVAYLDRVVFKNGNGIVTTQNLYGVDRLGFIPTNTFVDTTQDVTFYGHFVPEHIKELVGYPIVDFDAYHVTVRSTNALDKVRFKIDSPTTGSRMFGLDVKRVTIGYPRIVIRDILFSGVSIKSMLGSTFGVTCAPMNGHFEIHGEFDTSESFFLNLNNYTNLIVTDSCISFDVANLAWDSEIEFQFGAKRFYLQPGNTEEGAIQTYGTTATETRPIMTPLSVSRFGRVRNIPLWLDTTKNSLEIYFDGRSAVNDKGEYKKLSPRSTLTLQQICANASAKDGRVVLANGLDIVGVIPYVYK